MLDFFCGVQSGLNPVIIILYELKLIFHKHGRNNVIFLLYSSITDRILFRSVGARISGKFSIVVNFTLCPRVTSKGIFLTNIMSDMMYKFLV